MATINFNASEVEPSQEFQPLPEGHSKAFAFGIRNVRSIKSGISVAAIMGSDWEPHSFALLTAEQADAIRKIIVCTESQGICTCTC